MAEEMRREESDFSILDLHGAKQQRRESAACFQDLNLDTVIDLLAAKGGRSIRDYYRYLPETAEEEAYRRAVYGDVRKKDVFDALTAFSGKVTSAEKLRREKEKVSDPMQRAVWHLREIEAFCTGCDMLGEALDRAKLDSEGMCRFRDILRDILGQDDYRRMRDSVCGIMRKIRGLRLVISYEKDRMRVTLGEVSGEYRAMPDNTGKLLQNPFSSNPALTELENACLRILEKKKPELFREIPEVSQRYEQYEIPVLIRFEKESRFYLSYAALQREMEEKGFRFTEPGTSDDRPFEAKGLYDLALACVSVKNGKTVVANDFRYEEGESFFVLTGPNQGGKTTFARSMGQLVYFTRIGLDVPAVQANVPFFGEIQTHFSVEESVETGRGKLKEELVRLAPMMEARKQGSFVVINELFTTAASYDARIMGRKVLEHFIGLGCRGIYVTHLKELTKVHERVVSLQAMLDEHRNPTFEIRRGEATDAACAENQVNKYRLTYEQLKERL
ncbi:MAG: hypothetical protein IKS31_10295 [Clostridia bacterium]|nr:hypothetical protein [Clostridia bacterium]